MNKQRKISGGVIVVQINGQVTGLYSDKERDNARGKERENQGGREIKRRTKEKGKSKRQDQTEKKVGKEGGVIVQHNGQFTGSYLNKRKR